jgi:hypothetical protein
VSASRFRLECQSVHTDFPKTRSIRGSNIPAAIAAMNATIFKAQLLPSVYLKTRCYDVSLVLPLDLQLKGSRSNHPDHPLPLRVWPRYVPQMLCSSLHCRSLSAQARVVAPSLTTWSTCWRVSAEEHLRCHLNGVHERQCHKPESVQSECPRQDILPEGRRKRLNIHIEAERKCVRHSFEIYEPIGERRFLAESREFVILVP